MSFNRIDEHLTKRHNTIPTKQGVINDKARILLLLVS